MLKFVAATEVANDTGVDFRPKDSSLSGSDLGTLTMLVLNRFHEQVKWDDIVSIYVSGLVDDEDLAIIQRAVKALIEGGIEYV